MECSSGGWLDQFGCLLISPQTATDLTVTIVSALIALGVAIWILRRQFRHDRELSREQLERADLHAKAAAKLPHIQEVARALIALGAPAAFNYTALSMGQYGVDVLGRRQDAGNVDFEDILKTSGQDLPEQVHEQVRAIWADIATRRGLCHDAAKTIVPTPPAGGFHPELPIPRGIGLAAQSVQSTAAIRAERVGLALLTWDGFSPLDLQSALRGWSSHYRDRQEDEQRTRGIQEAFWRAMLIFVNDEDLPRDVKKRLVAQVGELDPTWLHREVFDWPEPTRP